MGKKSPKNTPKKPQTSGAPKPSPSKSSKKSPSKQGAENHPEPLSASTSGTDKSSRDFLPRDNASNSSSAALPNIQSTSSPSDALKTDPNSWVYQNEMEVFMSLIDNM